jgi:hypothetical protein
MCDGPGAWRESKWKNYENQEVSDSKTKDEKNLS